jgi:hypothetical protein
VFPHIIFFCYGFFQNCLSILFFNIELVDNYNYGFSHKTLWIATVFPHMLFFKILFIDFIFFNIELVENLALLFFSLKHCGLLRCFLTLFVLCFFFYDFYQNYFCRFYFFNIELIQNLVL